MSCGYTKYELYIIWKLCYQKRWCNIHIDRRDLVKGRPKNELDQYEDAIDILVKLGVIQEYKAQGRSDICMPRANKEHFLGALKQHQKEHDFIKGLEFIR